MTRFPCVIGRLPDQLVNLSHQERIITSGLYLGEVNSGEIDQDDPSLLALRQIIHDRGGQENSNPIRLYNEVDHTIGMGSVFPHDDPGYGLIAAAFVAALPLKEGRDWAEAYETANCWLITKHQQLRVRIGDVFVFDSDRKHAWMSNCRWCLINQRVSRRWGWKMPQTDDKA